MATPATTIAECIEFTPQYVADTAYENVLSLYTQFNLWISGLFGSSGIWPPSGVPNQSASVRKITNWFAQHVIARRDIEGQAVGAAGPVGVAAVINAVVRILYAIDELATNAQKTTVIALFNTCFPQG